MSGRTDAYILLTGMEIQVLLECLGFHRYIGLDMPVAQLTEEETVYIVHGLVKKGLLKVQATHFRMKKTVEEIITGIGNASNAVIIGACDYRLPPYCCYPAPEGLAVMQMSEVQKDTYRLFMCTVEEMTALLESEGYFALSPQAEDLLQTAVLVSRYEEGNDLPETVMTRNVLESYLHEFAGKK